MIQCHWGQARGNRLTKLSPREERGGGGGSLCEGSKRLLQHVTSFIELWTFWVYLKKLGFSNIFCLLSSELSRVLENVVSLKWGEGL